MRYSLKRVEEIFLRAIEFYPPEEREAFVRQECGADSETCERVLRLIVRHDKPQGLLDCPVADLDGIKESFHAVENDDIIGSFIGPYKLLQQIGEGGMGTVYMAEQTEPVQRRVAVKVIKPGMDSEQVIARFEAERQSLALMNHPNISSVLDAGTTPAGRPYFVMELVKGKRITDYCDNQKKPLSKRLELFVSVCRAVQHAHQKGIIHRDLKPSNILVAMYDSQPVPKVIDFGVAKAISQKLTDKTVFTQLGQVVGTLEYMSPEQAQFNQLDIDTRSDIYSLGAVLYEMLTGTTPFPRERLRSAALDEVVRIIRDEDPPTPSTRIGTTKNIATVAVDRHVEPRKLSLQVRGELDWIVMKALEKDRRRRYETANALAMDICRYLNNESVLACPPTLGYRLTKFTTRNKGLLATAASIAAILICASVFSIQQARDAWQQRDQAIQAKQETSIALKAVSQEKERGDRLLDKAFEVVDEFLVEISFSDNALRLNHGTRDMREQFLARSREYYQEFIADESQSKNETRVVRAYIGSAEVAIQSRALDDAIELANTGLTRVSRLIATGVDVDQNRLYLARLLQTVGLAHYLKNQLENATSALNQAIEASNESLIHDPENGIALNTLATCNDLLGTTKRLQMENDKSFEQYLMAEKLFEDLLRRNTDNRIAKINLATVRLNLAELQIESDPLRARWYYEQALQVLWPGIVVAELNAVEWNDVISSHSALWAEPMSRALSLNARLLTIENEPEQALVAYSIAMDFLSRLKLFDPERFEFLLVEAKMLTQIGNLQTSRLEKEAAMAAYEKSNSIYEMLREKFPDNIQLLLEYTKFLERSPFVYFTFGQQDLALQRIEQALTLRQDLVERYPQVPEYEFAYCLAKTERGNFLVQTGKAAEARRIYHDAETSIGQLLDADFPAARCRAALGNIYNGLAAGYQLENDQIQALAYATKLIELQRAQLAEDPDNHHAIGDYRLALSALGISFNKTERYERAIDCFEESIELLQTKLNDQPNYLLTLAGDQVNLAISFSQLKDYPRAFAQYSTALDNLAVAAEQFPDHLIIKTFTHNATINRAYAMIDYRESQQQQPSDAAVVGTSPDTMIPASSLPAIVEDVRKVCELTQWTNERYVDAFVEILNDAQLDHDSIVAILKKIPEQKRQSLQTRLDPRIPDEVID